MQSPYIPTSMPPGIPPLVFSNAVTKFATETHRRPIKLPVQFNVGIANHLPSLYRVLFLDWIQKQSNPVVVRPVGVKTSVKKTSIFNTVGTITEKSKRRRKVTHSTPQKPHKRSKKPVVSIFK